MWPWGHLALAYLCYSAYTRRRPHQSPTDATALLAALGSQMPDLVDKPLAWTLSVLPAGRTLGHSLLVVGPVLALAYLLARRRDGGEEPLVVGFGVGALAHLAGDALYPLASGEVRYVGFLAWPVVPPLEEEGVGEAGILAHFVRMEFTPTLGFELLLLGLAVAVWYRDGRPGTATVRAWTARFARSVTGTNQ